MLCAVDEAPKKQKKITVHGLSMASPRERERECVSRMSDGKVGMGRSFEVEWSRREALLTRSYLN